MSPPAIGWPGAFLRSLAHSREPSWSPSAFWTTTAADPGVHVARQFPLNMLVSTKGRERTFPEFRELLLGAGFAAVQYKKTGALVDAILATK